MPFNKNILCTRKKNIEGETVLLCVLYRGKFHNRVQVSIYKKIHSLNDYDY